MGKRVHVAKRYEVEWGDNAAFNWKYQEFYKVLQELGAEVWAEDLEFDEMGGDVEVPVEDYETAMESLQTFIQSPDVFTQDYRENLTEAIGKSDTTPEEFLKDMRKFYEIADKRDGYLHFSSF